MEEASFSKQTLIFQIYKKTKVIPLSQTIGMGRWDKISNWFAFKIEKTSNQIQY